MVHAAYLANLDKVNIGHLRNEDSQVIRKSHQTTTPRCEGIVEI
jgi:hypothetical protein